MISTEANTATIEIGPLRISFPMNFEPDVATGASATSKSVVSPPPVGEYWEGQGGIYVGVMRGDGQSGNYHLVASSDEAIDLSWGGYNVCESGASDRWDGLQNTRILVESTMDHPAAEWASLYTKDGHDDFYLPAQRELCLCYATIADKFSLNWYWSSTQYSAGSAWTQYFDDGGQVAAGKSSKGRARAVRRISI